jgi:hypothetical protein
MTKRLLTTAILTTALATVLGGCTVNFYNLHQPPSGGGTGDPAAPKVVVVNGNIVVDQDVLRFAKGQTNVRITWRLEGKGGRLTFPENGVVFERAADGEIVDCKRSEDNTVFSCLNRHSKPGVYRYGINANEDGKPLKPLDPYIMND